MKLWIQRKGTWKTHNSGTHSHSTSCSQSSRPQVSCRFGETLNDLRAAGLLIWATKNLSRQDATKTWHHYNGKREESRWRRRMMEATECAERDSTKTLFECSPAKEEQHKIICNLQRCVYVKGHHRLVPHNNCLNGTPRHKGWHAWCEQKPARLWASVASSCMVTGFTIAAEVCVDNFQKP